MNVKLTLEYQGTNYHGFQRQPNALTIQQIVEERLNLLTGEEIKIIGAGRTDAGVHALGQVVNFHTASTIPTSKFAYALNSLLPPDIKAINSQEVTDEFHSRYRAKSKTYFYLILNRRLPSAIYRNFSLFVPEELDVNLMKLASKFLLGKKDFSTFQNRNSETKNPVCNLMNIGWEKRDNIIKVSIKADRFLYGMVRNIIGTLLLVGRKKIKVSEFEEIFLSGDHKLCGPAAPPRGLFLYYVEY